MNKVSMIIERAKDLAKEAKTWADLSNALFDPVDGELARALPTQKEREEFLRTNEYKEIRALLQQKMDETGLVRGATPKKSGKFVVRLPKSLHAALEEEAKREGTSLNQLAVAKLAIQLGGNLILPGVGDLLIQAYIEVRDRWSADRVIADPDLDRKYLRRCRELGLRGTDFELNWKLFDARKRGYLSNVSQLVETKRYSIGRKIDEFEYASELAVRYLQETQDVSLDQIICDPDIAKEFDKYAEKLAPGFNPLEYRWAALGLRKAGRLGKIGENVERVPKIGPFMSVDSIRIGNLPKESGLYMFRSENQPVFLSQTDNLQHRIERHMEVSESRGLPRWLWDVEKQPLTIGVTELPGVQRSIRQAMEVLLVREWRPILNLPRKAA